MQLVLHLHPVLLVALYQSAQGPVRRQVHSEAVSVVPPFSTAVTHLAAPQQMPAATFLSQLALQLSAPVALLPLRQAHQLTVRLEL